MASSLMPGDDYLTVLSRFHNLLSPQSYVEIGVDTGKSLVPVGPQTKAIGIDPNPREGIRSHAKLYKMPSNEFFDSFNLLEELGAPRLALAFIDGLHSFEQALMDFINLERYSDSETVIVIHDCLPVTRLSASRARSTFFWCGDVWKVIANLLQYRPDLRTFIIPASPSGLGVVTNLNPGSTVLALKYDTIVAQSRDRELDYDFLDFGIFETLSKKYNIVPNDWDHITRNVLHKT
jgi:hypothetical protein